MTCGLWFPPTRRGDQWHAPLLALLSGCPTTMAPAWRARPTDVEPPVCVDGALRQLHWEHIWDAWEAEAGLAHSSAEQAQEQARVAAITPRGRPFWRVGQPLDSGRRRGGATVGAAPSGDSGWAAQATVLALVRSQAERWFALLRDENAALRDENASLKADIQAAQAAPAMVSVLPPPLASPAPRLPAAIRNAAPPAGRLCAPAELALAPEDVGRRRSSEGAAVAPSVQHTSFAAQLFASIGQQSPRLAEAVEDDDMSAASCEEEGGDDGDTTGRSHSPTSALAVRAQQRSDMHTCRVAAATCASSMAALTELLQLRWGAPEEEQVDVTLAAPPCAAAAPSVASSTAGDAGSVAGGKGGACDEEEDVESASLCGSESDGDIGSLSPRSSASLRSASLAHLASLRDGAAAAAAAVASSLRSTSSLRGVAHVQPSLPANANAAGEAAQAAVRELAEALHKAQGDADIQHWASAAAACATAGDPSVCAPALAVPLWQMMALSSAAETPGAGGPACHRESAAAPAPVLAYPSDYWQTSTCVDAHLRTMAPPMEPPIALVACDIRREDSAEFQSVDGGLTADECDDDEYDDPVAQGAGVRSVSVADAAAAHDEAAAAVAAALARVSTLPSPLELAAACAREADG